MPYAKEHKPRTRERVLASALRLFSERGYDQVTIDAVMTHAGLTRGGFYAHFASKEELYAEAIAHGVRTSQVVARASGPTGFETLRAIVEGYLCRAHVDGEQPPCPLAFFASDIGVREPSVRKAYTEAFRGLTGVLGGHAGASNDDDRALVLAVLMVGGVAVSTAITDSRLKDRVLESCREAVFQMARASHDSASGSAQRRDASAASRKPARRRNAAPR